MALAVGANDGTGSCTPYIYNKVGAAPVAVYGATGKTTPDKGDTTVASFKVIAHRGFWKAQGSAQNSRTSLRKAIETGCYGSEIDLWLTPDGHLMVNHDRSFQGKVIMDTPAKECRKLTLSNGETMPELRDMLRIMKKSDGRTKLIIEIKDHKNASLDKKAASMTVKAVRKAGIEDMVEYISFSDVACEQVISDDPSAKVAALSGGISPAERHAKGYTGIDYNINEFRNHPDWVSEAHELGMEVNVWTVNSEKDIMEMAKLGVDYITTDEPVGALEIMSHFNGD